MIEGIKQSDYIFVIHMLEQSQFAKGPLGMSRSLKRTVELLNCHFGVCDSVYSRAER